MNLMDLLIKISAKDEATDTIDSVVEKTKSATSSLSGIASGIEGIASKAAGVMGTVAKVGGVAAGAAATGVAALAKSATDSYADYEQLVGGVETLFGAGGRSIEEYAEWVGDSVENVRDKYSALSTAQNTLFANADNAYRTAGLSANDYMETATSFAASLVSSLGGDTVAAADLVQTAITDMADNANKMGTNISSIQDAYRGFAKQNYTMLDNLKLGYGGTAGEMARLLNDANKLDSSILGEGVELATSGRNILEDVGLEQMIRAINVIQTSMDITGTTAKEADTTIQGSVASMQSAWQNMLTGIADDDADFGGLVDNLVSSVETALSNLLPRIQQSISGVADLIGSLAPVVVEKIPELLASVLPGITDGVTAIISATAEALPGIVDAILGALPDLGNSLLEISDTLLDSLGEVAEKLVDGVVDAFQNMTGIDLSPVTDGIIEAFGAVKDALSGLFEGFSFSDSGALDFINGAIQALGDAISYVVGVVQGDSFQSIVDCVINLFTTLGGSLVSGLKPAGDALKEFFESFLTGDAGLIERIVNAIGKMADWASSNIAPILGAVAEHIGNIISACTEAALPILEDVINAIMGLLGGFGEGGAEATEGFSDAFVAFMGSVSDLQAAIITKVGEAIKSLMGTISQNEFVMETFSGLWSTLKEHLHGVVTSITTVITKLTDLFTKITSGQVTWEEAWEAMGEVVGSVISWIKERISDVIEAIGGMLSWLNSAMLEVQNFFSNLSWEGIKEGAGNLWDKAKSGVSSFFSGVFSGYADAQETYAAATTSTKTHTTSTGATQSGGGGTFSNQTIQVDVNIDGKKVADAVYSPLQQKAKQVGAAG